MKGLPLRIREEIEDYCRKKGISEESKREIIEKVKPFYRKALYDPEEAVGVVSAQSLSEPATQMSVSPHEKIIIKKEGITAIIGIGEFVDSLVDEMGYSENGWDVCDLSPHGIYVPSITPDERIEWKRVLECSRHKAPRYLIRISLSSGRKITATDSHSFVVRKNNKIVPMCGRDLIPGERLPVVKHLRDNCTQYLKLKSVVDVTGARKKMPAQLRLDESLGWLMGAYIAEGNSTKYFVSISNTNPEFLSKVRQFAGKYGFTYNEYDNMRGFARSHDIRVNSTLLSRLLTKTCGTGSRNKKIPQFAYGATEEFVLSVLRGYFDGDGNVSVGRKMIRASSNSEELISGVALLLSRFGIFATKQKRKQFSLIIPYKYAKIFKERIGFSVKYKQEKLKELCNLGLKPKQDFTDMISGYGNLFMDLAKKTGYPTRYVNNFTKRGRIGREVLSKYINIFEREAMKKGVNIEKEISLLRQMANSDVLWDRVTKIEKVKPTSKYVYDLTVEGTETFTTFEGVVTHNTMRTYHFAGTAGIQVTLGLPRLIEIYDAKKEPETPSMTIYLGHEYSTKEKKAIEIAKKIKEVKLRDFVVSHVIDLINLTVTCQLDVEKLKKFDLEPKNLVKHIKLKNIDIEVKGKELIALSKKTESVNLHKLKYKLLESHIKGVKNISHVIVSKDEKGEWVISTLGSNLSKILDIEGVDSTRTTCNNPFEIYDVLGVEAARNAIIKEAISTIEEQGLGVDVRYVSILADMMTSTGKIMGIGRYGIAGNKDSVLARMAFEETKKHIISAAIEGMKDPLRGHVENILMNQVIPMGTGAFTLVGKMSRAKKEVEEEEVKKKAKPEKKVKSKVKSKVKKRSEKTKKKETKKTAKPVKKKSSKKKK
ncbi:MAG: DNA-directed RNA polymerase subunit A'' [Candidatus Aenigmarchaeota archaeon]|nr:DNA-directed RNA polymerase subunit A'' [Candidatus Aenigmarchaeota archaeon]